MTDKTKVSFIGTDIHSRPMILKLHEKGYTLKVHDRYNYKETVVASGVTIWEDFPKEVTRDCQVRIACLPLPQEKLENMYGKNGLIEAINKGATWQETSTTNYNNTNYIASIVTKPGIYSLASPVGNLSYIAVDCANVKFDVSGDQEGESLSNELNAQTSGRIQEQRVLVNQKINFL